MTAAPALGALGITFTAMRAMQAASLITIIGLSANFVDEVVDASYAAPSALVGTLVVACLATIYICINYILYWDRMLPMLVATVADAAVLVMVIVVAVLVGKPVSYLKCHDLPGKGGNTANFISSLYSNVKNNAKDGGTDVFSWVDPDQAACYEVKALWGLSIALCILFAFSTIVSLCLWRRIKSRAEDAGAPKDVE
ncbi:Conserved hypothetical, protein [Geosmithia morbida]|uniref:Conserved hypothetical, protein n=1 Tax=Geosmithia morbida TaxID=1094350 RepID=A0A9P4Z0G5_9HYPO|nr:Conserved hypothetical, protein [Geosmithia morbida]KAF4125008.1 Conserved hypothetical, protein [Geosmithia morbida]